MTEASEARAALVAVKELRERIAALEQDWFALRVWYPMPHKCGEQLLPSPMTATEANLADKRAAQLSSAMDKLAGVSANPNEPAAAPLTEAGKLQDAKQRAWSFDAVKRRVLEGAWADEPAAAPAKYTASSILDALCWLRWAREDVRAGRRLGSALPDWQRKDWLEFLDAIIKPLEQYANGVVEPPAEPLPSERPKMPERPPLEAAAEHGGLIAYEAADYEWTGQEFARYALALELDREYLRGQINALGFKLNSVAADRDSRPTRREAITAMRRCETDNVSSGYDEVLDSVLAARGKEAKRAD
jgi:hypothetical protein